MNYILKNNIPYIIRKANEDDAQNILEYFLRVGAETDFLGFGAEGNGLSLEEEKLILKNSTSKNFFLIAELNGNIVGSCSINTNEKRLRTIYFGELGICVLKEFWNNKIGENLIKEALLYSSNAGLKKINLDTRLDNEKATILYEKCGFKKEGIITKATFVNNQFFDLLIMGKEL